LFSFKISTSSVHRVLADVLPPQNPPNCDNATAWTSLDTKGIASFPQNQGGPRGLGGKGRSVNIDHIYEVSLVDEFFAAQVALGSTCADTTTLFDVADGSSGGTRINTVFGQLASFTNPDFPVMETTLNGLEGSLWNAGLQGAPKSPANSNVPKQALANLAVVISMANNSRSLAFSQQPMLASTKPSKEMTTSSRTTVVM